MVDKYLLVGDLHIKKTDVEEGQRFIEWIAKVCLDNNVDDIIFLGDQYNDFGVARLEVMEFWHWAYTYLHSQCRTTYSLVGNHDINGDASASAMTVHQSITRVIKPGGTRISERLAAINFIRDNENFVKLANSYADAGVSTIICHAEFFGAQYDNGFYAPNGIPIIGLDARLRFVSGHIHKAQEFFQIWYPGSPRYLTRSDIGEKKGVYIWSPTTGERQFFQTPESVSQPFVSIEVSEGGTIPVIPDSARTFVDVKGSEDFIQKFCKELPDSVKVRTFPTQTESTITIKESEGLPVAFAKYAGQYASEKLLNEDVHKLVLTEIYARCGTLKHGAANGI